MSNENLSLKTEQDFADEALKLEFEVKRAKERQKCEIHTIPQTDRERENATILISSRLIRFNKNYGEHNLLNGELGGVNFRSDEDGTMHFLDNRTSLKGTIDKNGVFDYDIDDIKAGASESKAKICIENTDGDDNIEVGTLTRTVTCNTEFGGFDETYKIESESQHFREDFLRQNPSLYETDEGFFRHIDGEDAQSTAKPKQLKGILVLEGEIAHNGFVQKDLEEDYPDDLNDNESEDVYFEAIEKSREVDEDYIDDFESRCQKIYSYAEGVNAKVRESFPDPSLKPTTWEDLKDTPFAGEQQ